MPAPAGLLVPFIPGETEGSAVGTPITPPAVGDPAPKMTVEIAFDDTADDPNPVWTDLAALSGVAPLVSGNTRRGRSSEQDTIQAGSASGKFDNRDGDFTPSNVDGAYYDKVHVDKQWRWKATPPPPYDGAAAYIHRGFITSVEADLQGAFESSQTVIAGTDNSDGLTLVTLQSDLVTELLNRAPWGYWPLAEPKAASVPGDRSGNGRRPLAIRSYLGFSGINGTYEFGADQLAPSDEATSLQLKPIITGTTSLTTDSGQYLEVPAAGGPTLAYAQGFTFVMAFETSTVIAGAMSLLEVNDDSGSNLLQVTIEGNTQKLLTFLFPDANNTGNFGESANSYADGKPHLLVVTVLDDAKTAKVWVDGVLVSTVVTPTAGLSTVVDGRVTFGIGTGTTSWGFPYYGQLGHLAIFEHPLLGSDVARLWQAWQGFPGEDADDRIRRYLSYATWPAGTIFDDAASVLGLQQIGGKSVSEAISAASTSEQGQFFVGPDGTARFHSRHHRWNKPSVVTFDSSLPVDRSGLIFTEDRQNIANDVTATRPGGSTQRATDEDSISKHRRRTVSLDLAVTTDDELFAAVTYYVYRYSQPDLRVGSVVLDPYNNPQLWPYALSLEIGDRITLDELPPTAPAPTMDFFVESVGHDFSRKHFKTTLQLSPASRATFWQVGVPGFSEVGLTTRVGY